MEHVAVSLGLPVPSSVLEGVLAMDLADTIEVDRRWVIPDVIVDDGPDPVWRLPTLLPLPQLHQVPVWPCPWLWPYGGRRRHTLTPCHRPELPASAGAVQSRKTPNFALVDCRTH